MFPVIFNMVRVIEEGGLICSVLFMPWLAFGFCC